MTISFTFDDGLKSHATIAARELEARGWRGAFNVPTAFLGDERPKDEDLETIGLAGRPELLMTWDDARSLVRAGHEVYPHTQHHRNLAELQREGRFDEFRAEIDDALVRFEREMGFRPRFFCSPFHGDCRELRTYLKKRGVMMMCTNRPNFGADCPEKFTKSSALTVIARRYHEGRRHVDLMCHGILKEEGGFLPFVDREAFVRFLDEIKELEKRGDVRVVPYAAYHYGISPVWRFLAGREWALNKMRRVAFRLLDSKS